MRWCAIFIGEQAFEMTCAACSLSCENMFAETLVVLFGHHVSGRSQARKVSEIAGKEHGPKILTSVQVLRC